MQAYKHARGTQSTHTQAHAHALTRPDTHRTRPLAQTLDAIGERWSAGPELPQQVCVRVRVCACAYRVCMCVALCACSVRVHARYVCLLCVRFVPGRF